MATIGTCKLCGATEVRMAKSHVIPRSLYGDALKDPLGPAKLISDKDGHHSKRLPVGVYDTDMVCHKCEAIFGPWDDYVNKLLMQTEPDEVMEHNAEILGYVYKNPDYRLLKLFFISLLWRAHHSRHDLFSKVDVGRKYEKRLRNMILESNPGASEEFSVVLARFDDKFANSVLFAFHERYDGVGVYRFFFAQHVVYIKVTNRGTAKTFRPFTLAPDRDLFLIARDFRGSSEMSTMLELVRKLEHK